MRITVLSLAAALLWPSAGAALTAAPTPTPTLPDYCTPRHDPLAFAVHVEPALPKIGDEVRVTVDIREVDGLLIGHAWVALIGAAPLFGRDPLPVRQEGLWQGAVTFVMQAQVGGTTELSVSVDYETECACAMVCYYRRRAVSAPIPVTVLGPTATPTVQCTPPLCADGEVFACPGTCPGGCGTICATRTPTACPTPPCQSDETFFCPDVRPSGCGLTCATRTQTPIPTDPTPTITTIPSRPPVARGRAEPNPARAGALVRLLDDGSIANAGRFWAYERGPYIQLQEVEGVPSFVAPALTERATIRFSYTVCDFVLGCDIAPVDVAILADLCAGDCDQNRVVNVSELLTMVNVALGTHAISVCAASDPDGDGVVDIGDLVTAVRQALNGCAPPGPTPVFTPTPPPELTPTSCRAAAIPVVAPVVSPTNELEQTIFLCGIGYSFSWVSACGPAGCVEQYTIVPQGECPLDCPDPRQECVSGVIPLLADEVNALQVCQVPGIGCGPLPDLCAEEDVDGTPLTIEQRSAADDTMP